MRYRDRTDAGEALAGALVEGGREWVRPLVLALPRGGVPVAGPVAAALGADLDVLVVRKVGAPGQPELALGALAEGSEEVVWGEAVGHRRPRPSAAVDDVIVAERAELARRVEAYRDALPPPAVEGRDVVVVDDGLATGATAEAALRSVRGRRPRSLTLAVPVGPPATIERLGELAEVVCPLVRSDLRAVGQWYDDFRQTTDAEVLRLLRGAQT